MSQVAELEDIGAKHALSQGRTFVWHQVFGPTEQASIDFYIQALDWGSDEMPMGEMGTCKMLTNNGVAVAGVIATENCPQAKDVPAHWSVSIAVDDVDARAAKCTALGGTILQARSTFPRLAGWHWSRTRKARPSGSSRASADSAPPPLAGWFVPGGGGGRG